MPEETDGGVYEGMSEPGVDASYPRDPMIEPNKFPKDSYEDGNAMGLTLGDGQ